MWSVESGEKTQFGVLSRRNNSSSRHARLFVFGSLGLFTLLVAAAFALVGAWPVLPFAGLECAALFLAYSWLQRHQDDFEMISLDGDSVVVEVRDGGELQRWQLSRYWAQVIVKDGPGGRAHVFLRAHGREVEFGRLLTDEAKMALAKRLRARLSELS